MKRSIKLAVSAALVLSATSAFATNGDQMMALGAKSTGMGGTGVSNAHGSQSALANPALVKGSEVTFGGTIFMPSVEFQGYAPDATGANTAAYQKSDADFSVIPSVAFSQQVTDSFSWGLGMFGTAGMGTDYRDDVANYQDPTNGATYMGTANGTNQLSTAVSIMKFALPLAYNVSGFSIGVAPVIQYGTLGMSYNNGSYFTSATGQVDPATGAPLYANTGVQTGSGSSDDLGIGYEIGLAYEIAGVSMGAVYKSAIDMEYKNQISTATANFGLSGFDDHLEQPAEIGVGVSYKLAGNTLALDYKNIAWSAAKGYDNFGWEDQNVIAVGYEYAASSWAIRLGYNHSNNPIKEQNGAAGLGATGPTNYKGAVLNYFNMAGFPAVIEDHYTVGGTYNLSEKTSLDLAYVYSPEVSQTLDTSAMTQGQMLASGQYNPQDQNSPVHFASSTASVKHSQQAVTIAVNVAF